MKVKTHMCIIGSSIHLMSEDQADHLMLLCGLCADYHPFPLESIEQVSDKDYYPLPGEQQRYDEWLYERRGLR